MSTFGGRKLIYSKQIEIIGNLYLEYRNYWKAHAKMPLIFVFSGMDINPAEKHGPISCSIASIRN